MVPQPGYQFTTTYAISKNIRDPYEAYGLKLDYPVGEVSL